MLCATLARIHDAMTSRRTSPGLGPSWPWLSTARSTSSSATPGSSRLTQGATRCPSGRGSSRDVAPRPAAPYRGRFEDHQIVELDPGIRHGAPANLGACERDVANRDERRSSKMEVIELTEEA
jgi:hypothetical protein